MPDTSYKQRYADYLRSDQWRLVRKAVWKRDKSTCQSCGENVKLVGGHCHHRNYNWAFRELEDPYFDDPTQASVVLLCYRCHRIEHHIPDEVYIDEYLSN